MRLGGFEAGRVFGFRLRLDWSWFVVLVLLTWTFATFDFPFRAPGLVPELYWLLGLAAALLLFASVLVHELAHALVARRRGIPVERITLFIFGGVAEMRMEARRPADEFVLTIVGPLASLGLAGLFWGLGRAVGTAGAEAAGLLSMTLARLNLILAVFNMVPAFPLDGGRVLRSILWQLTGSLSRATRWAAGVGRLFGWLLIAWGAWLFVGADARLAGAWAIFLGWFLARAASSAVQRNRLRGLRSTLEAYPVTAALGPEEPPVSAGATVAELIRESLLRAPGDARLVVREGRPIGAVTLEDAGTVPEASRDEVPVLEVMTPLEELVRLDGAVSLADAADALGRGEGKPLLIGTPGGGLDVLTTSDVERWIERLEILDG